jgi:hypothetical protein
MSKSNRILQIILFYRFALFSQPQSGHIGRLSTNQKLRQDYFPDSIKDLDGPLYPRHYMTLLLDLRPVKDSFKLIFRFNQRHMQALPRPSPLGERTPATLLIVDVTVLWVFPVLSLSDVVTDVIRSPPTIRNKKKM